MKNLLLYSDTEIIQGLHRGDHQIYEYLFRSHYIALCHFCLKYVREPAIAEEIVQEIFAYLWEKRESIKITSSLKSYLYTAVKNKAINYLKLQLPKELSKEDLTEELASTEKPVEADLSSQEIHQLVQEAIDRLPEKCRIIFNLSRNSGLTYKEIAEELEISVKTVENQMIIALRKLREQLKPVWDKLSM